MNYIFNYDFFIFDLDDTLLKTEQYHYKAWIKLLKEEINDDFYIDFKTYCQKFHSNKKDFIIKYLIEELKLSDHLILIQKKTNYYNQIINDIDLDFVEGAEKFLNNIIKNNKKFVIVTNSSQTSINQFLLKYPILNLASKIYYKEMFVNRKPNPDCYLKVINDFSDHKNFIGFEDSITGIHAMSQVKEIKTVFINSKNYYHYDYIIKNYNIDFIDKY
jgi:beta-phosphoglucomutase